MGTARVRMTLCPYLAIFFPRLCFEDSTGARPLWDLQQQNLHNGVAHQGWGLLHHKPWAKA